MSAEQVKSLIISAIDNGNYDTKGVATASLSDLGTEDIKKVLDELTNSNEYSRFTLDLTEENKVLRIYDPEENLEGFEESNPSRKPCK